MPALKCSPYGCSHLRDITEAVKHGTPHEHAMAFQAAIKAGHKKPEIQQARRAGGIEHVGREVKKGMIDPFGVSRPDLVSKAEGDLVHVGEHLIGHGIGPEGPHTKARYEGHGKKRQATYRIVTDQPGDHRPRGVRVTYRPSRAARNGAAVAAVGGGTAGVVEGHRRYSNHRMGTNIGPGDPYAHPVKTAQQRYSGRYKLASQRANRAADRREAKGKDGTATRQLANAYAYNSNVMNEAARGGRSGAQTYARKHPFHADRKYSPPDQIGKALDPFGVERPDLVSKLAFGELAGATKIVGKNPMQGAKGFIHGFKGGNSLHSPGGLSGSLGALAGKTTRANIKPLGVGAGLGGGAVGGLALAHKDR